MIIISKPVNLYDKDVAILKDYNGQKYSLTLCNSLRKKGFEFDNNSKNRCHVNTDKLEENIIRAKARVNEYALCNDFDYFVTLTIDEQKYNRTDLKGYYKNFSRWLRNNYIAKGFDVKYLFIPELHKDGLNWHMHGFITGIPKDDLIVNVHGYLDWLPYMKKFGYSSIDYIHDKAKASNYITKYISKDLDKSVTELNARMYYCSKGLKKATEIKRGRLTSDMSNPDFENDYVKITNFDKTVSVDFLESLID